MTKFNSMTWGGREQPIARTTERMRCPRHHGENTEGFQTPGWARNEMGLRAPDWTLGRRRVGACGQWFTFYRGSDRRPGHLPKEAPIRIGSLHSSLHSNQCTTTFHFVSIDIQRHRTQILKTFCQPTTNIRATLFTFGLRLQIAILQIHSSIYSDYFSGAPIICTCALV